MARLDNEYEDPYYSFDEKLKDPDSFEFKLLMDLYQEAVDKHELTEHLMVQLIFVNEAVEKAFARKLEAKMLKEEAKHEREAATTRNEELTEEETKTVAELHRESAERVQKIKKLDRDLYKYEQQKVDLDNKIVLKDKEIEALNNIWGRKLEEAADNFIKDNFILNENGRYTAAKNPDIELRDGAVDVIKEIYTDAKSPAEMQKHNPNLIEHPERVMVADDVRKELHMARKMDKIVEQDVRDKANEGRKIIVRRIVLDSKGNPVYEVDASGKKKVKTERVELIPETKKLRDSQATDESTKKKKTKLVCLGDVCFIKNELIEEPFSHTKEETAIATKLLVKGGEKSQLEEQRSECEHNIQQTKDQIAEQKKGFDENYHALVNSHPELKKVEEMKIEETNDQRFFSANKKATEPAAPQVAEEMPKAKSPSPKTR
ncbi:MAG TPA: hypothetical protein VL360_01455 [Gammaproteobacteria bacterium]|jgi:hypothetical protein|nr:hypothetical protein [Gammaproteobacteria bacterium]